MKIFFNDKPEFGGDCSYRFNELKINGRRLFSLIDQRLTISSYLGKNVSNRTYSSPNFA